MKKHNPCIIAAAAKTASYADIEMDVTAQNEIISLLEDFIEEDDSYALHQALGLVEKSKFDITSLLNHLENFRGDLPRKRHAITAIRKQLGLSIIPGPVCRRSP